MENMKKVASLSERLIEAMSLSGKKQIDLSRETGVSRSTISRSVAGEIEPTHTTILKLAAALNVSDLWLYGYDVSPEPASRQIAGACTNRIASRDTFAENLRYYIKCSQKTQKEIADALGVSTPTFNDWVNGKKYPRIDKIDKLADYFGVSKADLIESHQSKFVPTNSISQEILDVILRLCTDSDFLDTIERLNTLTPDQFASIKQILNAFTK